VRAGEGDGEGGSEGGGEPGRLVIAAGDGESEASLKGADVAVRPLRPGNAPLVLSPDRRAKGRTRARADRVVARVDGLGTGEEENPPAGPRGWPQAPRAAASG